jgi:hypothetical protein
MVNPDATAALTRCGAVIGVSVVISSLETLLWGSDYESGGLFDGRLVSQRTLLARSGVARMATGWLFHAAGVRALVLVRLVCGLALIAPAMPPRLRGLSALSAFVAGALLAFRRRFAGDGSDQMTQVVLAGTATGLLLSSSSPAASAAAIFIAAQACLAYVASGIAKLISPVWRSGSALTQITNTATYGRPAAARWLARRPGAARLCSWAIIMGECGFPLVLVAPSWLLVVILAGTISFHLGCAVVMGFNTFFWSFLATYPAILYARALIRS